MTRGLSIAFLTLACLGAAGCGEVVTLAERYRAEEMLWWAQRAESAARLGAAKPDSATLLGLREEFAKVGKEVRPPYVRGTSPNARLWGRELLQIVGSSELQAARLAVQANRPDLALAQLARVAELAESDSLLRRQSDFFRVGALRQLHRRREAIALMREMLVRYRPVVPLRITDEDPVLAIPEGIIRMLREEGDEAGVKRELAAAEAYYRSLLMTPLHPGIEAQVRTRLMRVELERGDGEGALRTLTALESMVRRTPELSMLLPEIQFSRARLRGLRDQDRDGAILLLDRVAVEYPESRFAPNAIYEAGLLLEKQGKWERALDHFRTVAAKYPTADPVAPQAVFRRALLEERMGDWESAKNILESLPVQYPMSQPAVDAPIAIVNRYVRVGNRDAAEAALAKARETYRSMIARDTTSPYCTIYRWSIARVQLAQGDWGGALETIDEMVRRELGHPYTADALLRGAAVAQQHGQAARAREYLELFLKHYPKSPAVEDARRRLRALAGA